MLLCNFRKPICSILARRRFNEPIDAYHQMPMRVYIGLLKESEPHQSLVWPLDPFRPVNLAVHLSIPLLQQRTEMRVAPLLVVRCQSYKIVELIPLQHLPKLIAQPHVLRSI